MRAFSCQITGLRVMAIMVGMIGCGGAIAPDATSDAGASDGGPQIVWGCPTQTALESGAAVGTACSSEGTYCADLSCDPCTRACAAVSCSQGRWVAAIDTADCTGGLDAGVSVDARADSMTCVQLDPGAYDQSCTQDSDCVAVSAGTVCNTGSCLCNAAAVNVSASAAYQDMVKQVLATEMPPQFGCSCPFFGNAACINGACRTCGGASPACPDGG